MPIFEILQYVMTPKEVKVLLKAATSAMGKKGFEYVVKQCAVSNQLRDGVQLYANN